MNPLPQTELTDDVVDFMQRARASLGDLPDPTDVYAFGDSPRLNDELLALVLSGVKTATCNWPTDVSYREGDVAVVRNGAGRPVALLETLELREVPFLEVDETFAWDEGEDDRSLASWRENHWRYFSRLSDAARPFSENEKLLCERFRVLYTEP